MELPLALPEAVAVLVMLAALSAVRSRVRGPRLRTGYYGTILFLGVLMWSAATIPPIPVQTILVALAMFMLIISDASVADLFAGVVLHPIMVMAVGFMAAGALGLAGGYDAALEALGWIGARTPLGVAGVAVVLANLPALLPLPCGRIMAAALLPAVVRFGDELLRPELASVSGGAAGAASATYVLTAAFIVNAAASCAPSRLGGLSAAGEGQAGLGRGGSMKGQQLAIMLMTATTALAVALVYLGHLKG